MARKIMQDMVVRKKRHKVRIEEKKDINTNTNTNTNTDTNTDTQRPFYIKKENPVKDNTTTGERIRKPSFSKFKLAYRLAIALFFVFVFVFVLKNFSWVTIAVTPNQEFINLDTSLWAYMDKAQGSSSSSENQNIYFELMEIVEDRERVAKSTGVKDLERKASGQIIIYNAYSSAPQTLVRRTRFSTPEGKIYRIDGQVIVPGAKIVDGNIVPSSIEATVYADEAGEEYNIGLTDFNIPGFNKSDARYEKFYARSKTDMAGGFVGGLSIISEDDIFSVKEDLKNDIKNTLIKKAESSIPNGFLYYTDLVMLDFVNDDSNPNAGDEVEEFTFKEKGILRAFLIRETDLSDALVSRHAENAPLRVSNLRELSINLTERDKNNEKIVFSVSGMGHFVWTINADNLKKDFLREGNNGLEIFLKKYPVENIKVTHHPSWWRFAPKDDSKIEYKEILKAGL